MTENFYIHPRDTNMERSVLAWTIGMTCGLVASIGQAATTDEENASPEAAVNAVDAAPDDPPRIRLTLVPNQVSVNRSVSFNEHGQLRNQNHQLSVGFRCLYETDDQPLSYSKLVLTSITTSAGESLDVNSNQHHHRSNQTIQANRRHQGKPFFNIYFNLPAPRFPAESLREIRGTVTMQLSEGPERVIRLSPISKYLGKRFKVIDMDDTPMSLRLQERGENMPVQLEFSHPRAAQSLIRDISFYDARGVKLEIRQRGSGSSNDEMRRYFELVDDKSTMVVRLFRQTREATVPFVARHVPLPVPEPAEEQFDFALETEPVEMANADFPAAEDDLEAAGEDAHIIILE
ncbi:MAG: hypothetical protein AAF333_07325 [Planctomycetota bacterium]